MAKLPDFITAENELDGQEHVYIAQGGKTRKTLLQKIKEFVIGTTTMGTTATDITGAIAEHTSQLNEKANRGFIINSDFQIWQRGESFTLGGSPQYSSDRWAVGSSTSQALKIEKVDSGLKMTWLKQEIGVITQYLELPNKKRLIGKKISVSISINNLIYTYTTILDDINKYINFDLSNKVFTVETHTDTKYYIRLFHSDAPIGTTYEINHIRDVFGSVSNFIPISYGEELALCQRYYEVGEWSGKVVVADNISLGADYKVEKRIRPTVKIYSYNDTENAVNKWGLNDVTYTVSNIMGSVDGIQSVTCQTGSILKGEVVVYKYVADAEIYN